MDTGGKLDQAIAAYTKFREAKPKPVMMFIYGSTEGEALKAPLRRGQDCSHVLQRQRRPTGTPGWIFGALPAYTDQFGRLH